MTSYSNLQEFVLSDDFVLDEDREFILPRFGEKAPLRLRAITNKEYQEALVKSTKWDKDGKSNRDIHTFYCAICMAGISNFNFNDVATINKANDRVNAINQKLEQEAEEVYNMRVEEWEKDGKDPEHKPKKMKPDLRPAVETPKDLLEFTFYTGELDLISEKILELSGFGTTLQEVEKQAKN